MHSMYEEPDLRIKMIGTIFHIYRWPLIACLLLSIFVSAAAVCRAEQKTPYRLSAIEAYLYYSNTGTFSINIIDNKKFILWNVIIGEGSAHGYSNDTFIKILLKGKPGGYPEGLKIVLTARTPLETLLERESSPGIFASDGKYYAGYWLYGTGCTPVEITVRLIGKDSEQKLTKTIPFECGE